MKKIMKVVFASLLAATTLFSVSAKEIKRTLKPTAGWNLYVPGKK